MTDENVYSQKHYCLPFKLLYVVCITLTQTDRTVNEALSIIISKAYAKRSQAV